MPTLKINDIDLYYEQHGEGPDLVLIGGLTSDHLVWKSTVRYFSPYFRVLIFDNRGAGQSSTPDYPYTIDMMANDVLALMDLLGIQKAHVLGHSMGGAIAMQLALIAKERLNKLIVACARTSISAISTLFFTMREKLQTMGVANDFIAEYVMPFIFSETFLKNKMNVTGFAQWSLRNPHPQSLMGFKNQFAATRTKTFGELLSQIESPTLVIGGTEDIIAPLSETSALAKSIPHAILKTIEHCGHMPHVEYPKIFAESVLDFLEVK